jgi:adenosylcobalamin-dependent ribonucleoside-triphosphate reductase
MQKFQLSQDFLSKYRGKQPNWGPLGQVTFKRTYSRPLANGLTEEFYDTIKRVVEGCYNIQYNHCMHFKLPWNAWKAQKSAQKMFEKMWNFKFLPPGRGLWLMGTPVIDKIGSAGLNNCGFVSTKDIKTYPIRPFKFLMDMSMLGVGVGFDVLGAGTIEIKGQTTETVDFEIQDTRESWVDSLEALLAHHLINEPKPIFTYNKIRLKGTPIKGFGGTASGPGPLKDLHDNINNLFKRQKGKTITSEHIVDIMNMIGVCVVAGNVRRTAEIALGPITDDLYINLKQDEDKLNSHRWASNNSVFAEKGMDYSKIITRVQSNGEPGFVWLDNIQAYGRMKDGKNFKDYRAAGTNPCGEQSLESFELCCLVETFPSLHEDEAEYIDTLKYAYLYAKSVTLINTHWAETNAVMLRNRRIGTSQTGIIQAFEVHGRRKMLSGFCDNGYSAIQKIDKLYSDWLCIPRSIKTTTVKPSGTVSLLAGVTPGIHYPHSEYYIRRIRFDKEDPILDILKKAGYSVEADTYSKTSDVVEFPVKENNFYKGKKDATVWEQLENAAQYQHYWSDNQVSITVDVTKDDFKDMSTALELYESRLKSVSFLPYNDHGYKQAPYEEIDEKTYLKMKKKLKQYDLSIVKKAGYGTQFCDGDACEIPTK